jgi:nucleoside-diphosphate-sugar epimerase
MRGLREFLQLNLPIHSVLVSFCFALFLQHHGCVNGLSQPAANSPLKKKPILILGLGQVGRAVAEAAQDSYSVFGTVQGTEDTGNPPVAGIQSIVFGMENLESVFPNVSHVLVTIPPPKDKGDSHSLNSIYDNMIDLIPEESWIGILSTTGVYGHHDGKWVDENSELLGEGESASRYQRFEQEWLSRVNDCNRNHTLNIFRCAGIYGPNSSALHTLYKRGLPSIQEASANDGVTNRIHLADIARAILNAISKNNKQGMAKSRIYNLSDDLPESRNAVMQHAAKLLASRNVSLESEQVSGHSSTPRGRAARRNTEWKLVSNKRLKDELLPDGLKYPTYVEGLQAILDQPNMPWSRPPTG